ncbi:MAG TPA: UDP-N-acetylglucosamine--N-acetylmuramyl-(pentapeptide) pyrophosphoryl-undecaprenol N-acetylglucosamine transferase [Atribacteraceae bacterium]|nr:UDP-N-acetylglucosamine--N-acetylmuramyl-(pentapeptide) pyrophosphoryl-undecaprenol N-acetylglucosamine transferase [Atribacteraceae bacterium]
MRRFYICAGGTAGHIFPGLAVAEELQKEGVLAVHFIGTRRGMEDRFIGQAGFPLHYICARGWDRTLGWSFFRMLLLNTIGFFQAFRLIAAQRPCGILCMGSYVSLLIGFWGRIFRIPLFVHEQNVLPGLANRVVSRWARKIFISFEDSLAYFQNQDTISLTGNPLRKTVREWRGKQEEARAFFGFKPDLRTVFVIGGSLGSSLINRVFAEVWRNWTGTPFQVIHTTGKEEGRPLGQFVANDPGRYLVFDFLPDPGAAYAAADVVVCRAGASTTFEVDWFQLPAIMIPFEGATESHQELNAGWLRRRQPVEVFGEREFNPINLARALERMFALKRESWNGQEGRQEAAELIAKAIVEELQRG